MKYIWGILSAALLVAGLVGAIVIVARVKQRDLLIPAPALATRTAQFDDYRKIDGSKLRDFDVSFDLTLAQPQDNARILVNVEKPQTDKEGQFDNAYYIDLNAAGTTIGSFEGGLARQLGKVEGKQLAPGVAHRVILKRRTPWLSVVVDDRIIASLQDETHSFGDAAIAIHGGLSKIEKVKVQPIESIYFSDNFMQDQTEKSHWTALRGDWAVSVINDPAMSVDAFYCHASSPDVASSVTGEMYWDNYSFSAAARSGPETDSMGLLFYYRSEKNYYLLNWERRDETDPKKAHRQLIRMQDGVKTVLAESPGGFIPDQWYTMTVEADGRTIRAAIDGTQIFSIEDDSLVGGMIGLYANKTVQTRFDDVVVNTVNRYSDDMKAFPSGRWTTLGGAWQAEPRDSAAGTLTVRSDKPARAVTGSGLWQNYKVTTDIEPAGAARCGLDLYYSDEKTRYAVTCDRQSAGDTWKLVAMHQSGEKTLGEARTSEHASKYHVQASANRGVLTVSVDGKPLIEAFDLGLNSGSIGLWAEPTLVDKTMPLVTGQPVLAKFTGLAVDFLREDKPLVSKNFIMEHERTMGEWSGLVTDWEDLRDGVQWNRGFFPGSSTLELKMSKFDQPNSSATIVLNGDGDKPASGYRLVLGPKTGQGVRPGERVMSLYRAQGEAPVAQADMGLAQPGILKLERSGGMLLAYSDGRVVLTWRDDSPLKGDRLAWGTTKEVRVDPDDISVSSPNVYQYNFAQAPTDWRSAGGRWEVTNRWECDPRWSFFSGKSKGTAVAALWAKRIFKGDVTVEFYVGPKMDSSRGRGEESYARDFDCTICADGNNLASGYSFLLGGFDNAKSCIYKGSTLLADAQIRGRKEAPETVIPRTSNLHRQWLQVRIQKRGDTLQYYYERKLIAEVKDDKPLQGDRIAFWTKDCGIMLGKVTISCENARQMEGPDVVPPAVTRSIYDPDTTASTAGVKTPQNPN